MRRGAATSSLNHPSNVTAVAMDQITTPAQLPEGFRGLSETEAGRRLDQYGPNEIPRSKSHPLTMVLSKFWGPVPWMLEAIILLQALLGRTLEAVVIALLLCVNAAISFVEEGRASKALDLLRGRLTATARVLRDDAWRTVASARLVPGDIVHLRMGDLSPADVRIIEGEMLLDQSALTGESMAVEAGPGATVFAAAVVKRGEATGEVVATGRKTRFGKTAELVGAAGSQSHLTATIFQIVRILMAVDAVLITILLIYALATGLALREVLPFALILLVASVPVALPATFTLATALGAAELARAGVLLTRLTAIEEAAGMDVLCTDKTGTLTENRLTLSGLYPSPGCSEADLLRFAALACDSATQDPIDLAILDAARARNLLTPGLARFRFVPFDPATRYALGAYHSDDGDQWVAKGALEALQGLTRGVPTDAPVPVAAHASGARLIGVAEGASQTDLRIVGLLALQDPPRADSAALISGLKGLGLRVVMVTGDSVETAVSVAEAVGLAGSVAGSDTIEDTQDADLLEHSIYARVFPEHKIRLVERLQKAGHIVGMTGDGVNDAPALKQADVGIAVAAATDVARSAAGVVLTQPGLSNVLTAIEISRRIYQRMLTYTINKIMKTFEIAVFLSLGVILTHTFVITPLLVVLLLFTNDFVTMSIATDRVGFSRRPDRWNVRMLMLTGGILALCVLVLSFAVFFVARDLLGLPLPQLQTLIFVMLVATGQGNVYLVRERGHLWESRPSRWLIVSSMLDVSCVTVMAVWGVLMAPVDLKIIIPLLVVVALYLLILDQFKVRIMRRLVSRDRVAASPG